MKKAKSGVLQQDIDETPASKPTMRKLMSDGIEMSGVNISPENMYQDCQSPDPFGDRDVVK